MSTTTVPSSQVNPDLAKVLNLLRSLPETDLKAIRAKLTPEVKFGVPRTPASGIEQSLTIDDLLEAYAEQNAREGGDRPNTYHFSKIGNCFRKEWYTVKNVTPDSGIALDDPTSPTRFDPGDAEPGNAVENHLRHMMESVYAKGRPGVVLKDIRMSKTLKAEDGKPVYITGRSDLVIVGDNLEILDFTELKTPKYWPRKKTAFTDQNGKTVPLFLAGIEEPENTNGIVNVNNALQLAIGVHILAQSGRQPKKATLMYVNRERYREHVQIIFTPQDVEFLHDFAVWWVQEHHHNLQQPEPPAAQFLMSWECGYCPFAKQCTDLDKSRGERRNLHPAMVGINSRLAEVNKTA